MNDIAVVHILPTTLAVKFFFKTDMVVFKNPMHLDKTSLFIARAIADTSYSSGTPIPSSDVLMRGSREADTRRAAIWKATARRCFPMSRRIYLEIVEQVHRQIGIFSRTDPEE